MNIVAKTVGERTGVGRVAQTGTVVGLQLLALGLWGLHLYVRRFPPTPTAIPETGSPEATWWGLWPITYLPTWVVVLATLFIMGSIVIPYLPSMRSSQPVGMTAQWILWLMVCLLVLTFFAFPTVHTRWGDAYILTNAIAWPDPALRLTHSWQAPLDVFLHSQLWLAFHERFGWTDAMPVYRLLSPVAGILYLLVVLALSRDERLAPNWLTFGLLTTLGMMQLFFGYVENYSFAAVGILAYLWLGIGVLNGERPLWLAASVLALTHATHPSTIILAPSLLYCGWQVMKKMEHERQSESVINRGNLSGLTVVFQIALPMLVVAGATILLMEIGGHGIQALLTTDRPGGSDARWFVPLMTTETRWEHYTLFSWPHLHDFLNQQLLVAPIILASLIIIGGKLTQYRHDDIMPRLHNENPSSIRPIYQTPPHIFLLITAISYLLFTWVWNPDYGGQRDWDLFSLASIPTTLLLIALLSKALPRNRDLTAAVLPLLLLQLFHTIAWVYQNTLSWAWPT